MADVFVSYARGDKSHAERLAHSIEALGWSVFWDRKIRAGRKFREVIEEALQAARCVIVLWSKTSVASEWVLSESDDARKRGILVPVLIEKGIKIPRPFEQLESRDLCGWDGAGPAPAFQLLAEDLAAILPPVPRKELARGQPEPETKRKAEHQEQRLQAIAVAPPIASVPHYRYDVFVSYAAVDDYPMADQEVGWVTTLVRQLQLQLARVLGGAVNIFTAKEPPDEGVAPEITEKLRDSATLLVILSPGYVSSAWRRRGSGAFLNEDLKGQIAAGALRVFVVEMNFVDRNERPAELADLRGCQFWKQADAHGPRRTLCEAGLVHDDPDYSTYLLQLHRLSSDLARELKGVKRPAPWADPELCVFLAEVTVDLDRMLEDMRSYLESMGVRVLPAERYQREPQTFRNAMKRDLGRCKLFVQLLSGVHGWRVPDLAKSYPRFQYDIAQEAGIAIIQWRSPALHPVAIEDADHASLLDLATVRAEPIEDFKREVGRRLALRTA